MDAQDLRSPAAPRYCLDLLIGEHSDEQIPFDALGDPVEVWTKAELGFQRAQNRLDVDQPRVHPPRIGGVPVSGGWCGGSVPPDAWPQRHGSDGASSGFRFNIS